MAMVTCYNVTLSASNNIWMTDDVMIKRVPLLCLQIAYNLLVSRFLFFILKPLHVPLLVAQMLVSIFIISLFLANKFESSNTHDIYLFLCIYIYKF